ncbi:hypothetical protein DAI21_10070 [Lelliottia sp. WB101]|uniref:hypothetical protein n=1 Tax=Lelliottia sp. WB101 TaxID=2153385 RepID=UPI000D215816|nr:hypothetical protein [Lelliottia sp. WB101]AVY97981.1 hypothetical protein DAI21_10070 [Lelliottia sp. WB101]
MESYSRPALPGVIVPDYSAIISEIIHNEIAYRSKVIAVVAAESYESADITVDKINVSYTLGGQLSFLKRR